ncbi:unnamed protein product [Euphydryas editha]|uniref:FP protein C-terminal domain-containing protein n=1 Tax=Euphydryas editha TaxID=104508 RepID=A0AAU9UYY5_EUPED|nr:unnamed protein product [Euphydryas editha]
MASEAVQWGCCINKHGIDIEEKSLKCPTCGKYYHCAYISLKKPPNDINTWKCPSCKSSSSKAYRNDSIPIRNVSTSRGSKRQVAGSPSPPSLPNDINDIHVVIREIIQEEFSGMLVKMNETIISTINQELEPQKKEMQGIRDSISFMNDKFEDIKKEQQSSNKRETLNYEINDKDILHCTRIAKTNPSSTRPRSIVVQLASTRLRDQLLAAVVNYNRINPQKKLNSSHLGYAGLKSPVYVVEHLSPNNKALHAAARIKAKEMNYKYVWVRNGKIFVRKSEGAELIQIRNKNSLSKII